MKIIITLLLSFLVSAQTLMVSHKGAWKDHVYPQNTLASINKALVLGFKGIEFDVQITKDEKIVMAHDDKMDGVSNCKGRISEKTLFEVKQCLIIKNTLLPISQILTKKVKSPKPYSSLKELLHEIEANSQLELIWIDFKTTKISDVKLLTSELMENLSDNNLTKVVINNMSKQLLSKVKQAIPLVRTSLEGKWGSEPLKDYNFFFDGIGETHDMISLNVGFYLGHEPFFPIGRRYRFNKKYNDFVKKANELGVEFIGWTVNKKRKIEHFRELNIPYLLTDRIDLSL